MKKITENKMATLMLAVMVLSVALMPFSAEAQNLNKILTNQYFKQIISFGLGMYAAWKWFEYFNNFSPSSAFRDIIVPAIITYLAFQWSVVLGWFGITGL